MISAHRQAPPGTVPGHPRGRRPARRSAWLAVAGAVVAVASAGCSSSGTGGGHPSATSGSPTATMTAAAGASTSSGGTAAGSPLSAAALASKHITSMSATTRVTTTGASASTVTGTITEQTRPPLAQYTVKTSGAGAGGVSGRIDMVLAGKTIYLKVPSLASVTHKPWLALKSSAPGGAAAGFAPLIQAFQQDNPVTQAQGLSAATGVHQVGTATIGGIATTEYSGSFSWAAAAARIDPSLRKELGSALTSGAAVHFSVWIDGQHYVRKIVDSTTGPTGHSTVQVLITSINQPVHIAVPPASQIGAIPGV